MLNFEWNILNYAQYNGSRTSYVKQFSTCNFVQTAESPYEHYHVTYAHIQTYIYRSMELGRTHELYPK